MSTRTAHKKTRRWEKFVTDELAKAGAMLDEGLMAETRAKTVHARTGVCSLAARSRLSLFGGRMERL